MDVRGIEIACGALFPSHNMRVTVSGDYVLSPNGFETTHVNFKQVNNVWLFQLFASGIVFKYDSTQGWCDENMKPISLPSIREARLIEIMSKELSPAPMPEPKSKAKGSAG